MLAKVICRCKALNIGNPHYPLGPYSLRFKIFEGQPFMNLLYVECIIIQVLLWKIRT
jgi:hypothetical protein